MSVLDLLRSKGFSVILAIALAAALGVGCGGFLLLTFLLARSLFCH